MAWLISAGSSHHGGCSPATGYDVYSAGKKPHGDDSVTLQITASSMDRHFRGDHLVSASAFGRLAAALRIQLPRTFCARCRIFDAAVNQIFSGRASWQSCGCGAAGLSGRLRTARDKFGAELSRRERESASCPHGWRSVRRSALWRRPIPADPARIIAVSAHLAACSSARRDETVTE